MALSCQLICGTVPHINDSYGDNLILGKICVDCDDSCTYAVLIFYCVDNTVQNLKTVYYLAVDCLAPTA
jgi:hypothetical protein